MSGLQFISLHLWPLRGCSNRQLINVLTEKKLWIPRRSPQTALSYGHLGVWWGILRFWDSLFWRVQTRDVKELPIKG